MPFLKDPAQVAAQAKDPSLAANIRQGLGVEGILSDVGGAAKRVVSGGGALADKLLGTGSSGAPGPVLKGISAVSDVIQKNPRTAIGTALLAPILYNALQTSHARERDRLMNAYTSPYRDVIASVLEKTAAPKTPSFSMGSSLGRGLAEGAGKGLGGLAAGIIGMGIGKGVDILRDRFLTDPKRKEVFERLLKTDPVLSDAVHRNPDAKGLLLEAYGTMTRFAPTLALDVNAVRSFLREAVLGGSGVNYATVKNLVDTERSIADSKSHGLPGVKV